MAFGHGVDGFPVAGRSAAQAVGGWGRIRSSRRRCLSPLRSRAGLCLVRGGRGSASGGSNPVGRIGWVGWFEEELSSRLPGVRRGLPRGWGVPDAELSTRFGARRSGGARSGAVRVGAGRGCAVLQGMRGPDRRVGGERTQWAPPIDGARCRGVGCQCVAPGGRDCSSGVAALTPGRLSGGPGLLFRWVVVPGGPAHRSGRPSPPERPDGAASVRGSTVRGPGARGGGCEPAGLEIRAGSPGLVRGCGSRPCRGPVQAARRAARASAFSVASSCALVRDASASPTRSAMAGLLRASVSSGTMKSTSSPSIPPSTFSR